MIKLENTAVMNMDNAIRGMRNPMNSWDKSDSYWTHIEDAETKQCAKYAFYIGENDLALMRKLATSGSDHRKFLRQIMVSVDITAPLYWWKEFDTYKVGTVANSCSTMHKIHEKEFTLDDFSHEHLFTTDGVECSPVSLLNEVIYWLNWWRMKYLETKDKKYWWQMIQLLPSSYNQLRTITLNYEVLLNQYHARNAHKLDEWHTYCDWIESLPYFKEICL